MILRSLYSAMWSLHGGSLMLPPHAPSRRCRLRLVLSGRRHDGHRCCPLDEPARRSNHVLQPTRGEGARGGGPTAGGHPQRHHHSYVYPFRHEFAAVLVRVVLLPRRPASPPSPSSKEEREDFGKGLKDFLRNPHLILIVVAYGVSFGVVGNWLGFMTYSLLEIGIHQEEAMGVGISSVVGASVSAFVAARLTDRIYGHLKVTIIGLLAASFAFFLWFFFLSTGVVEATLAQVYISVTLGVALQFSSVPILLQLCFDLSYPISEGVVGAVVSFFFAFVSLGFLLLFLVPDVGYVWVSYVLVSCVSLSLVPVVFVEEKHKRTQVDMQGGVREKGGGDRGASTAEKECSSFVL
nr:disrupted in renal carcinoma protein 2 homolog [Penaeus vannamei]